MNLVLHFGEETESGIPVLAESGTPVARLQVLLHGVLRIEEAVPTPGTKPSVDAPGFVDEPTFTVTDRGQHQHGTASVSRRRVHLPGLSVTLQERAGRGSEVDRDSAESTVRKALSEQLAFRVAEGAEGRGQESRAQRKDGSRAQRVLEPLSRYDVPSEGIRLPRYDHDPKTPEACETGIWYFRDAPRCVEPWTSIEGRGAWRIEPFAGDWYVFAWDGDAEWLREQFMAVTGSVPVPPLWMFGMWHSRYYPYRQHDVLNLIDEYRARGYPLDAFVVDTDWRTGASRGYRIDESLFPDMGTLFSDCHARNVRVMFNDHPEHRGRSAFDEGLIRYRRENLGRLLNMGLDAWWFDRNWREIFLGPDRGLGSDVWGQFLYWEIDRETRQRSRVPLLSMRTDHPAGHRYPIWWTGDIHSDWATLREAIEETVDSGTQLFPYTGQDIGGHDGFPSPEQLVRWIQWGSVSPTFRLHCGPMNRFREPWRYDETTDAISKRYAQLRMRLIPLIYSAAWHARRTGMPILRDASLVEPDFASRVREQDPSLLGDEFFLGDDLWVAPIRDEAVGDVPSGSSRDFQRAQGDFVREVFCLSQGAGSTGGATSPGVPTSPGGPTPNALDDRERQPGRLLERKRTGEVHLSPTHASRDRGNWGTPFFVRWRGHVHVARPGWYRFVLIGSGVRTLRVGDSVGDRSIPDHVRADFNKGRNEVHVRLPGDTGIPVEAGYFQSDRSMCSCCLSLERLPDTEDIPAAERNVHLPPGEWIRLADGTRFDGNQRIRIAAPLDELPMFVRRGAVVPVCDYAQSTADIDWSSLTLHILPPTNGHSERVFMTDAGQLTDDVPHWCEEVSVCCSRQPDGSIRLTLEVRGSPARSGTTSEEVSGETDAADTRRPEIFSRFNVRLHLEKGEEIKAIQRSGEQIPFSTLTFSPPARTSLETDRALSPDAPTVAFDVELAGVADTGRRDHKETGGSPWGVPAVDVRSVSVEIVTDRANRTP